MQENNNSELYNLENIDQLKDYPQDLEWLQDYIRFRLDQQWSISQKEEANLTEPASIPLEAFQENYQQMIAPFASVERLVILTALANQVYPTLWNTFGEYKVTLGLGQFGLLKLPHSPHLQATLGTALFLMAGNDPTQQKKAWKLLSPGTRLRESDLLEWPTSASLLPLDTIPRLNSATRHQLITEEAPAIQYTADFPATPLTTIKTWDELILNEKTATLVGQARKWVRYYAKVNTRPGVHRGQGYRLMMSGPSGTGKTMTAALLGQDAGKPVYRIDISNIVDKYVGETSKKLRRIFEVAEAQDWILFFDEGDALFGKRSEGGQSSNERYANQEVSYLLYKMEEYQGMIFLATNNRHAIDSAFRRRFDSLIKFQETDDYTRQRLWKHFFEGPGYLQLDPAITQADWRELAANGQVSAAWIEKFYAYCVMQTTHTEDTYISAQDMQEYLYWFGCEHGFFEKETGHLFQRRYQS